MCWNEDPFLPILMVLSALFLSRTQSHTRGTGGRGVPGIQYLYIYGNMCVRKRTCCTAVVTVCALFFLLAFEVA